MNVFYLWRNLNHQKSFKRILHGWTALDSHQVLYLYFSSFYCYDLLSTWEADSNHSCKPHWYCVEKAEKFIFRILHLPYHLLAIIVPKLLYLFQENIFPEIHAPSRLQSKRWPRNKQSQMPYHKINTAPSVSNGNFCSPQ